MQRFNINIDTLVHFVLILFLFSVKNGWSDDLDLTPELDAGLTTTDIISTARDCFAELKKRGTVWLKTQQAMDRMLMLEKKGSSSAVIQAAQKISHDCRLINNQHALEQARYLLSTMEENGVDDRALDAIRVQLRAADGEASLALAKNLQRERTANRFQDQSQQMDKAQ